MPDIFISYASQDKIRIKPMAVALAAEGWTVFWDRAIKPGENWHNVIGQQLKASRCVVVAWSTASVGSDWVRDEAAEGKRRNALIPLSLDAVDIPLGFGQIQNADLKAWDGDPASMEFRELIAAITLRIGPPSKTPSTLIEAKRVFPLGERSDAKPEGEKPFIHSPVNIRPIRKILVLIVMLGGFLSGLALLLQWPFIHEPEMVRIEPGQYLMGSDLHSEEQPRHWVKITKPFGIGRFEVTFEQYDAYARTEGKPLPDDNGWGRGKRPVINVSWHEAIAYAEWLSVKTGKRYRLPSEAEWEYAARAGMQTNYWWGNEAGINHANCSGCGSPWDGLQTAPAGSFLPNAWGLHDTAGNVWEWLMDCEHESYKGAPADGKAWIEAKADEADHRMVRGGSWYGWSEYLRSASRYRLNPGIRSNNLGFRLAQDP